MEPLAGLGGFLLAQVVFAGVFRWAGVMYVEVINQPPEMRRLQTIIPVVFLHSGPWIIVLLAFGAFKFLTAPTQPWHAWFIGGFIANLMLMGTMIGRFWKLQKSRKTQST